MNRWRQKRATNYLFGGEFEKARRLFLKLHAAEPGVPGMRHNLALTYIGEQRFAEGERLLLEELSDFGEHYPRLKALADLYYMWGRREAASEFYAQALDTDCPEEEKPLIRRRIEITGDAARFERARESLKRLADGNELLGEDRWEEALQAYQTAVELDETNLQALNNTGTIQLNHARDPALALETFKRACAWSPLPWLRSNLMQAQRALAQREIASRERKTGKRA